MWGRLSLTMEQCWRSDKWQTSTRIIGGGIQSQRGEKWRCSSESDCRVSKLAHISQSITRWVCYFPQGGVRADTMFQPTALWTIMLGKEVQKGPSSESRLCSSEPLHALRASVNTKHAPHPPPHLFLWHRVTARLQLNASKTHTCL